VVIIRLCPAPALVLPVALVVTNPHAATAAEEEEAVPRLRLLLPFVMPAIATSQHAAAIVFAAAIRNPTPRREEEEEKRLLLRVRGLRSTLLMLELLLFPCRFSCSPAGIDPDPDMDIDPDMGPGGQEEEGRRTARSAIRHGAPCRGAPPTSLRRYHVTA
jgi:hypothetical protein